MARKFVLLSVLLVAAAGIVHAQSSTSPGIDIEIFDAVDGDNDFCVEPDGFIDAFVYIRPGSGSTSCSAACGGPIAGGTANIATGVIDIAFDSLLLTATSYTLNSGTVAEEGLIQNNPGDGRIGWALAGNWAIPGDPYSGLDSPCDMTMLNVADWAFLIEFQALSDTSGFTKLHLRRQSDTSPFELSFADICGSPVFTIDSEDIDEIIDAWVLINDDCASVIFFDGFESTDSSRWDLTIP